MVLACDTATAAVAVQGDILTHSVTAFLIAAAFRVAAAAVFVVILEIVARVEGRTIGIGGIGAGTLIVVADGVVRTFVSAFTAMCMG